MLAVLRGRAADLLVRRLSTLTHAKLFKPDGFMSQFAFNNKTTALRKHQHLLSELPAAASLPPGTMAIGRLDQDSEGLLLLTTDGRLSHFITKSRSIEKEYWAQVEGDVGPEAIERLARGGIQISLGGGSYHTTLPCVAVRRLATPPVLPARRWPLKSLYRKKRDGSILPAPTTWLSLTLVEGKKRQVRKSTAAVGHPCIRLVRVRVADVTLGDMRPGQIVPWDPGEALLRRAREFTALK